MNEIKRWQQKEHWKQLQTNTVPDKKNKAPVGGVDLSKLEPIVVRKEDDLFSN